MSARAIRLVESSATEREDDQHDEREHGADRAPGAGAPGHAIPPAGRGNPCGGPSSRAIVQVRARAGGQTSKEIQHDGKETS